MLYVRGRLRAPSGGSGGLLADARGVAFKASNAYSSVYHLWVSHVDWSRPVGLIVWFHGDGAWEYTNPDASAYIGGDNGILAEAKARNAILVVPLTPDNTSWTWWKWGKKTLNPQYAAELIQYLMGAYNIDRHRVWLCGFSGGSEFLALYLLRYWGDSLGVLGGGCLMVGGGTPPPASAAEWTTTFKDRWRWRWVVGDLDTGRAPDGTVLGDGFNAVKAATNGEAYYRARGWQTELITIPGKGHLMSGDYGGLVARFADTAMPPVGLVPPVEVIAGGRQITQIIVAGKVAWQKGAHS